MSGERPMPDRATTQSLMRRLDGFARGLGRDEATTRLIVEKVVTDMPEQPDEQRMMEARKRMLLASA